MSEEKTHAKYSPSSAERWMNCPGSIALSKNAPKSPDNKWSIQGTLAHTVFECAVTGQSFKKKTGADFPKVSRDMIEHATKAWETIQGEALAFDEVLTEEKVKMPHIHEEFGGTLDLALVEYRGELWVIDYKYGVSFVPAQDNLQLISYAVGLLKKLGTDFTKVNLGISQPRAFSEDGPFRFVPMEVNEVLSWEGKFKRAIDKCEKPNAPLNPGKWCHWCPASTFCPAISTKSLKSAQAEFSDETGKVKLPEPQSIKDIGKALAAFEHIETWMSAVKNYAFDQANAGVKIPGWKLVAKRGQRAWIDEKVVERDAMKLKFVGKIFTEPELKSPAQLEKVLGKEWVNKYCETKSSGMTLVSDDDKRMETSSAALDFTDEKQTKTTTKEKTKNGKNGSKS